MTTMTGITTDFEPHEADEEYIRDYNYDPNPRLGRNTKEFLLDGEILEAVYEFNEGTGASSAEKKKGQPINIELPDMNCWQNWGGGWVGGGKVQWTGFHQHDNEVYDLSFDSLTIDLNGKIIGNGDDNIGYFIICGSVKEDSNSVEFIKQYSIGHSVFFNGEIENGKIIGEWTLFDTSTPTVDYFQINCAKDIVFSGYSRARDGSDQKLSLNLVIQGSSVFGMGDDKKLGSYFIRGDYNKTNGLINFVKKYFQQPPELDSTIVLHVGRAYEDRVNERFIIGKFFLNKTVSRRQPAHPRQWFRGA
jgi:hypothetical protein